MIGWRLCMFMLLVGTLSCRKDEVTPDDLLYRRWRMTQIQYSTGKPVDVTPTEQWSIVAFKYNGTILYGDDGKYDPCCSPLRFKRKGNTLDLVDVEDISFPERTPNPICVSVSCVSPGDAWQINILTDSNLVIKQDYAVVNYKLYP